MDSRFKLTIPIVWQYVRDVRRGFGEALADQPAELRAAAVMVASELVENAIKYGESVPGAPSASIELFVSADQIRIEVTNGLRSAEVARELDAHLKRIAAATDRAALYVERLHELLDSPERSGKLGLHRIGLEAGFDLSCTYEEQKLTIVATRGIV